MVFRIMYAVAFGAFLKERLRVRQQTIPIIRTQKQCSVNRPEETPLVYITAILRTGHFGYGKANDDPYQDKNREKDDSRHADFPEEQFE
jgi:hypothetical protein